MAHILQETHLGALRFLGTTQCLSELVVLLPAAFLLSLTEEIAAVWFAFPIAEIASLITSVVMMLILYRKKIKPLYENAEKTT